MATKTMYKGRPRRVKISVYDKLWSGDEAEIRIEPPVKIIDSPAEARRMGEALIKAAERLAVEQKKKVKDD